MRGAILMVLAESRGDALQAAALERKGFSVTRTSSRAGAAEAMASHRFDALVLDLELDEARGLEWCAELAADRPELPVVVVAGNGTLDVAVNSMRAGAYDFLTRPLKVEELVIALDRAVQHRSLKRELKKLRRAVRGPGQADGLVGSSPVMQELSSLVEKVATTDVAVLLCGETGTGKELVARALHRRSRRSAGPFVAVNCAAMPEALLESELFGHVKGAFTDARAARAGLFVQASGGTLFLDEIGDMPLALQPKLLRALQERAVRPVGSDKEVPFDARVISATHRDLESWIEEGRFRRDLYFRINVIQLDLPPLRSRGSDILELARHFLVQAAQRAGKDVRDLGPDAARHLLDYRWPGNVRELENVMERAVALTTGPLVEVVDLPARLRTSRPAPRPDDGDDPQDLLPMHIVEERYIRRVLGAVGGNKTRAAKVLGFDRKTLYRKLVRYGLAPPEPGEH